MRLPLDKAQSGVARLRASISVGVDDRCVLPERELRERFVSGRWLTCTPQEAFSFGSIFLLWQYADRQRDAGCSTVAEIALNVPNTDLDHAEASGPRPGVLLSRFSTAKRRDGPAFGRSRS